MWQWEGQAFGEGEADALAAVTVNLRFPGQYFDEESEQHYNWMRNYDPGVGRYTQSDPIGLSGGLNAFGYGLQNPARITDRSGQNPAILIAVGCSRFPQLCYAAAAVAIETTTGIMSTAIEAGLGVLGAISDNIFDTDTPAANDAGACEVIGDNQPGAPSDCIVWKARVLAQKENAETLFLVTEDPLLIANVNAQIAAYNASCGNATGRITPLLVEL